ncbi:hypothetical protein [Tateyamaria sp.]|uniref:hypothetical protein n=1 Tax=Tateyamaria sp. TaxID=1929288 RepID=UPI003B21053A
MECGFFHPEIGYWQTTDEPSAQIRADYPEGTVEVPMPPGPDCLWDGKAWVPDPKSRDEQRAMALLRIDEVHAGFLRSLTGNATVEERDTWQPKVVGAKFVRSANDAKIEAEIARLNADHPDALHDLATLVDDVGEDLAAIRALADTVLRLSLEYKRLIGKASGLKRRAKETVTRATNETVPVEQVRPALEALFVQLSTEVDAAVAQWRGQTDA